MRRLGTGPVRPALLCLALLLGLARGAAALEPVVLAGQGGATTTLDEAALRALPSSSLPVTFETKAGPEHARWTGALLWDVLARIGLPPERQRVGAVVVVAGKDGYAVAFSLGELDPELGGAPVLLCWSRDGADLPASGGPRLVVPGDKRGARAVKDVARIELR